jgi:hypothetical protein
MKNVLRDELEADEVVECPARLVFDHALQGLEGEGVAGWW